MESVDVSYINNKSGTYVQFMLPVSSCELEELNAYDKFMRQSISQDFKVLFDTYDMEFTTDAAYVIRKGNKNCLVSCLQGNWSPQLEDTLKRIGVEKRDIQWGDEGQAQ